MSIDYDHSQNSHTLSGANAAIPLLFAAERPQSLLDVGCGTGTWLKAAQEFGIADVFGVDGIAVAPQNFLAGKKNFQQQDLTEKWKLGRRFDAAICLEVAEHLDAAFADNLIESLTSHADTIIFGAACPGQHGQHHVNCQWPAYWQKLFNGHGFACTDGLRWKIWDEERIEPWYRQNIFTARRDPGLAGKEPRILPVVHPAILQSMVRENFNLNAHDIGNGALPLKWYLASFPRIFWKKLTGRFK